MGKKTRPVSCRRHAQTQGMYCPKCGSDEIEGNEVTTGNGMATQEMGCLVCGATWTDTYRLTGYTDLMSGEN